MLFQVLGPLRLVERDHEIPLRSQRRRALLAALLVHQGEAVPLGSLVEALWGGGLPESARQSLQSHVSRLRSTLRSADAPQRIVTRGVGYALELTPDDEVDATQFEQELEAARRRLDDSPSEALRLLETALERWRGPAFADVPDAELVRIERVRLEELRQQARDARVEA
ncbi:MAG: winged helix-turn-helix domain-containing protein, partial [Actinomycetota bacterium]|nr:winged helix-turn-helix domain-containing protein [Actinomycetota bacterium]